MHRNAVLVGILSLLLGIGTIFWTAPTVAHTSAVSTSQKVKRVAIAQVPSSPSPVPTLVVPPSILPVVDKSSITENHQLLATVTLNALPSGCRDRVKTFIVQYTGAKRRGLGGKSTIILDGSVPDDEFVALLTHECAHVIHGNLLGTATAGASAFRDGNEIFFKNSLAAAFWSISWTKEKQKRADAADQDFISGYAKTDAFEDFAETFAAYVLQRDMLRERALTNAALAAKLAWMETNVPLQEDVLGNGTAVWEQTVPWDITKLPLTLASSF